MAFNEILVGRLNRYVQKLLMIKNTALRSLAPDLITVLDSETADAIPTERVRYGQRVTVIAMPCAPVWRTARAGSAGPR